MKTINRDTIEYTIRQQWRTSQLWINAFRQHRDGPGCKNAALAIGKISGMFQLLQFEELPDDLVEISQQCEALWEEISTTALRPF